ncbi:MAG: AsmA family protein [Candidatus Omnitrophota bacterium]
MKVIRILLITLLTLVVIISAGIFVFIKTFDLNKYIPQITEQARKALGRDLKIGRADITFSLTRGVFLDLRDMAMSDDTRFSLKPFMSVDRVFVGLDVGGLVLAQKVQLTDVLIQSPRVTVIRSKEGFINVATVAVPSAGPVVAVPKDSSAALAIPALWVNVIRVADARVTYIDQMSSPGLEVTVEKLDIDVRNFSLTAPFDLSVKAAVFSLEQNVNMTAKIRLDLSTSAVRISQLNSSMDLARIDLGLLGKSMTALEPLGLSRLSGMVSMAVSDLGASAKGAEAFKAQIMLDKGAVAASTLPLGIENIVFKADVDDKQVDVSSIALGVAGGTINGNALIVDYLHKPVVSLIFHVEGLDVKELLGTYKLPLQLKGVFSGAGSIKLSGKSPEEFMASLNGDVKGELKEGLIENLNLISLGFDKIPMLPGLMDSIMVDLSTETQDEVRKGITVFQTCAVQARLVNGVIQLDAADLTTRDLLAHAKGVVDLKNTLDLKVDIRMAEALSARLVRSVKELSALKDDKGQIYIPVGVTGDIGKPTVMPDVSYLTQKLVSSIGGEALQNVLGTPEAAEAVEAIFGFFKKK